MFFINLQTLDGQEDYGTMSFRVAPLTLDEFRRYGTVIPECEKSFWLATGMGAPNGTDFRTALSGSGTKRIGMCPVTDRYAIRPAIMVSAQAVDQEKFLQDFSTEELEAELQRREAVAVCNLIRPLSEFEEKEKTRMSPENYNFEEMVSLCNELKELSCFCELLNMSHEKGYPKELFSHMRYSQNAMNDFLHDHGNAKSLEETKNNIRTAKSAWFAPDFIEYFEKVKAQNAQWYCTGKPILAKTWDKAPVVLPVGCLFEDYIEFLMKEVSGMGGLDADWRMHADGVVGLSLYDLSHETILFRNKDSARAFFENVDLSDMIVDFLIWEGDAANGHWVTWEE